ncbi:hypothetical protein HMPREF0762_01793 [Slackia exigua ATCC 700122]|uniref:Uncharacterized protein n=1 Tax=Slackia exigua (strain ATCC 700122 / DSM 15923 / CIP 105133 / JCM 11022 / KCTC 5966 / S-7) TaxID=649764 RepID=D0WIW8_SLAES|nr:hypothetical protein HMPREF0762_01793 [Slackia exigua ATCC 700122]
MHSWRGAFRDFTSKRGFWNRAITTLLRASSNTSGKTSCCKV